MLPSCCQAAGQAGLSDEAGSLRSEIPASLRGAYLQCSHSFLRALMVGKYWDLFWKFDG
jgi:hypothetical protein